MVIDTPLSVSVRKRKVFVAKPYTVKLQGTSFKENLSSYLVAIGTTNAIARSLQQWEKNLPPHDDSVLF